MSTKHANFDSSYFNYFITISTVSQGYVEYGW